MSRSLKEATRFTPTRPHALSKYNLPASKLASPALRPAPGAESPLEKVARLREAARRAQEDQLTRFDRVVLVGRRWADRAHRIVVYSLLGATVLSFAFGTYAITDMIRFTRRKSRAWVEEQMRLYTVKLGEALAAEARGDATEEQVALLDKERKIQAIEQEDEDKKGWWYRWFTDALFGNLKNEDASQGAAKLSSQRVPPPANQLKEGSRTHPQTQAGEEGGLGSQILQTVGLTGKETTDTDRSASSKGSDVAGPGTRESQGQATSSGLEKELLPPQPSGSVSSTDTKGRPSNLMTSWFGGGGNGDGGAEGSSVDSSRR